MSVVILAIFGQRAVPKKVFMEEAKAQIFHD